MQDRQNLKKIADAIRAPDQFAAGRLAGIREAAEVARKVAECQAQGWRENPKTDGCGGAIAASNTGLLTVQAILALAEGKPS